MIVHWRGFKQSIRLTKAGYVVDLLPDLTRTEHEGYSRTVHVKNAWPFVAAYMKGLTSSAY